MENLSRTIYTFNYDGRTERSFDDTYKGLLSVLESSEPKIPLEIEFSMVSILTEEQRKKINDALLQYNREPIFN